MSSQRMVPDHLQAVIAESSPHLESETKKIVEAARIVTGATGAVIGLRSEGGYLICRASTGHTAPPLGSQFNAESGISGECVRTGRLLVCHDSEDDPRVDPQVCRLLGVRSIVALPVSHGGSVLGILEVFSDVPGAFSDRHLEVLKQLAGLVAAEAAQARVADAVPLPEALPDAPVPSQATPSETPAEYPTLESLRSWTIRTFQEPIGLAKLRGCIPRVNAAALVGLAALLLFSMVLVVKILRSAGSAAASGAPASARPKEALVVPKPSASEPIASMKQGQFFSRKVSTEVRQPLQNAAVTDRILTSASNEPGDSAVTATPAPTTRPAASATAEVIAPPDLSSAVTPASAGTVPLPSTPASLPTLGVAVSGGVIEGELTHRVQPIYPMFARERHLEGAVVLRVLIAEDGAVRQVDIVHGDSMLAEAAVRAVRQWRYKPYQLNNRPVSTTIDVTINFKME